MRACVHGSPSRKCVRMQVQFATRKGEFHQSYIILLEIAKAHGEAQTDVGGIFMGLKVDICAIMLNKVAVRQVRVSCKVHSLKVKSPRDNSFHSLMLLQLMPYTIH